MYDCFLHFFFALKTISCQTDMGNGVKHSQIQQGRCEEDEQTTAFTQIMCASLCRSLCFLLLRPGWVSISNGQYLKFTSHLNFSSKNKLRVKQVEFSLKISDLVELAAFFLAS